MGLLDNQTQSQYYGNTSNYGNYQFVSLENIINAFMVIHVGEGKIISKVSRTDVQFHAMRAMQELSYDVFRSVKTQEIEIPPSLKMILPQDYVNYVKLAMIDDNGIEKNLYPTGKTSNPFAITQDASGVYQFEDTAADADSDPDTLVEQSPSNTLTNYQSNTSQVVSGSSNAIDALYVESDYRGRRYGLDPQFAQENGTFYIDYLRGYIHLYYGLFFRKSYKFL